MTVADSLLDLVPRMALLQRDWMGGGGGGGERQSLVGGGGGGGVEETIIGWGGGGGETIIRWGGGGGGGGGRQSLELLLQYQRVVGNELYVCIMVVYFLFVPQRLPRHHSHPTCSLCALV